MAAVLVMKWLTFIDRVCAVVRVLRAAMAIAEYVPREIPIVPRIYGRKDKDLGVM